MLSLELPQRADTLLVEVQTEPRKISIDHIAESSGACASRARRRLRTGPART